MTEADFTALVVFILGVAVAALLPVFIARIIEEL